MAAVASEQPKPDHAQAGARRSKRQSGAPPPLRSFVGRRVAKVFPGHGKKPFEGYVKRVDESDEETPVYIAYDDGDREWITVGELLEILQPLPSESGVKPSPAAEDAGAEGGTSTAGPSGAGKKAAKRVSAAAATPVEPAKRKRGRPPKSRPTPAAAEPGDAAAGGAPLAQAPEQVAPPPPLSEAAAVESSVQPKRQGPGAVLAAAEPATANVYVANGSAWPAAVAEAAAAVGTADAPDASTVTADAPAADTDAAAVVAGAPAASDAAADAAAAAAAGAGADDAGPADIAGPPEDAAAAPGKASEQLELVRVPYQDVEGVTPAPAASQAVVFQRVAYVACSSTEDADYTKQTSLVLAELDRVLSSLSSSKRNLLTVCAHLQDVAGYEGFNAAWQEWVEPGAMPVLTVLQGASPLQGALVVLQATAAIVTA